MTVTELQTLLGATADGAFGPASRAALLAHFTNPQAPAITGPEIAAVAAKLGCTVAQIMAVASVESSGSGFDNHGRPKILFERHLFHRMTDGKFSPASFSQAAGGGYNEPSWDKLGAACGKDPDAAFAAVSWGKFQVLGMHWSKLSYASPYDLAHSTVSGEAAHYDLFARFIATFGLMDALRKVSRNPDDCRDFAKGFNGAGYRNFDYHTRIAAAVK